VSYATSTIKSIQTGEGTIASGSGSGIYITADVTITAVVVAKSICYYGGIKSNYTASNGVAYVYLSSATNVKIQRVQELGGTTTGRFTVVEYY
tara:strand:- start:50 stop:328 length:279 start_codon:yes stop_codon:yes gene_type:complete